MKDVFDSLIDGFTFTSDLVKDLYNFLIKHNRPRIAVHSLKVAQKAKILASSGLLGRNLN